MPDNVPELLKIAAEIAKAYARSDVNRGASVQDVLEAVYKKLKDLSKED